MSTSSKDILLFILSVFTLQTLLAQVNPSHVQIVRDKWGVAHVFGKTDADAAYGLAWAHAEDNFEDMQLAAIQSVGRLAEVEGVDGALFDFFLRFFEIDSIVEAKYHTDLSPEYLKVLEGYIQGVNRYAELHPKEVKLKGVFPITAKTMIKGYTLVNTLMAGTGLALKAVNDNLVDEMFKPNEVGSNAMAIAPHRTEDGKAWLIVNSHQPIEGRFAWYEVHVQSEEGWNMTGGVFPGGMTPFLGSNEHLGWAHTVNYHNFGDIFKLTINPENKKQYLLDGQWADFREKTIRFKVKLIGMRLPIKRKVNYTVFGPVFKNKAGDHYAFRFPASKFIHAPETWFRMNKATNLEEFEDALKTMGLSLFNTLYADNDGNIFYYSAGQMPLRNPDLDWKLPITSNSSQHISHEIMPYDKMPHYRNPSCGYLYNGNNTPIKATCHEEAWRDTFPGMQLFMYNRGDRMEKLFSELPDTITWNSMMEMKYEKKYDSEGRYGTNFKSLYELDENKYPKIADAIKVVKKWNLEAKADNEQAALLMLVHKYLAKKTSMPFAFLMIKNEPITEEEAVDALSNVRKYMLKKYGKLEIPLGEIQKLVKGDKVLPVAGMSEVMRACDVGLYNKRKGLYKMNGGDGYMMFAKYANGEMPELYTVTNYGTSNRKDSPHYTDQMEMFVNEQTKHVFLDKETILKEAVKVYSPK